MIYRRHLVTKNFSLQKTEEDMEKSEAGAVQGNKERE